MTHFAKLRIFTVLKRHGKLFFSFIFFILCLHIILKRYSTRELPKEYHEQGIARIGMEMHTEEVNVYFEGRLDWFTSNLGSMIFKYDEVTNIKPKNKTYIVLVWKYWNWLKARHLYNYGPKLKDPLRQCSVKNCIFTGDDNTMNTADAVVIHLQRGRIPKVENRNPQQRWIFLTDESPEHTFSLGGKNKTSLKALSNVFNWSMTYRSDADIPVPYGRVLPLEEPVFKNVDFEDITTIIPNWKKKRRDVLVTALISNCIRYRMSFIRELQKYIPVDVYGGCAMNKEKRERCPRGFRSNCEPISEYIFYLVLENSYCREYLTEKTWYHAFTNGAIPIIIGVSEDDCLKLLPPQSYLYIPVSSIRNATTIKAIASNIVSVSRNLRYLKTLHYWRNDFAAVNEHGYFGTNSYHFCRVCEALNYNDEEKKIYSENDLRWFLDPRLMCGKI